MARALINDLDDTLSRTQKFHSAAESEALERYYGLKIPPQELTRRFSGMSLTDMVKILTGEYKDLVITAKEFRSRKEPILIEMATGNIRPMSGALEYLERMKKHFPLALASQSSPEFIDLVLRSLKIQNRFDAIVSGHQVSNGKPDPAIFILAAENLGFIGRDRMQCAVVGDAVVDAEGAERADMKCIIVSAPRISRDEYPFSAMHKGTLDEITVDLIRGL